jgi:hypothetical protein
MCGFPSSKPAVPSSQWLVAETWLSHRSFPRNTVLNLIYFFPALLDWLCY